MINFIPCTGELWNRVAIYRNNYSPLSSFNNNCSTEQIWLDAVGGI